MRAMLLGKPGRRLVEVDVPDPVPGPGQVRLRVKACAVCRTDLHVVDGELPDPKLPLIPGHEVVGVVDRSGEGASRFPTGTRAGVPWLGWTCGICEYCLSERENLCDRPRFTGYQLDGGYAEMICADERFCFPIPSEYNDAQAAPLLCAGLIGYRAWRMVGDARVVGFYGFGAAAHILLQLARHEGKEIFAFTRPGDREAREFAMQLGAGWAGGSDETPPAPLDAAILFAPAGALVPAALRATRKGGVVVCAGIHMSDIPSFPYRLLWEERVVRSVANLTRRDGDEFLRLAPQVPITTEVETYRLDSANEALDALRAGRVRGAAVLVID